MRIEGTGFAQFHVITRGQCVCEIYGQQIHTSAGDILLFPKGCAHVVGDQANRPAIPGQDVIASLNGENPLFSEGEHPTRLICGHYEYHARPGHPVIEELPSLVHIRSFEGPAYHEIQSVLQLLMQELNRGEPGMSAITERLSEVLLIKVLRAYFEQESYMPSFYAGLADARLARAIACIHRNVSANLTLDVLAKEAGMSRSGFAADFKEKTGIAPIEYLTKLRMLVAVELLLDEDASMGQIAEQVGYESEIAFSRAFKRTLNMTPSEYRRQL